MLGRDRPSLYANAVSVLLFVVSLCLVTCAQDATFRLAECVVSGTIIVMSSVSFLHTLLPALLVYLVTAGVFIGKDLPVLTAPESVSAILHTLHSSWSLSSTLSPVLVRPQLLLLWPSRSYYCLSLSQA